MASAFDRALDDVFIGKLAIEATKEGWWADVLADPSLVVALRGKYLNVYWRGQSLFYVESVLSGFKVTTHEKYLVDPKLASQVTLADRHFDITSLVEKGFIRSYEGPATLAKMKSAASLFSGLEKTGCHEIAVLNSHVIDCEIALTGSVSTKDEVLPKGAPRIDLASIEPDGKEGRLVFWEAKHYTNGDLRPAGGNPPAVVGQVDGYNKYLSENQETLEKSYTKVAMNFLKISKMGWKRQLSPLIVEIGEGERRLTLGAEPKVGLIIFGFDLAQRDHPAWKDHLAELKKKFTYTRAIGAAKHLVLKV